MNSRDYLRGSILETSTGGESQLAILSSRITWVLILRQFVRSASAACVVLAVAALVVRVGLCAGSPALHWGACLFVPAAGWAVVSALRGRPSRATLLAVLDRDNRCGGLLTAGEEVAVGDWRVEALQAARLRWRAGKPMAVLCCSAAFLAASLAVPQRYRSQPPGELMIQRYTDQLDMQIDALRKEEIIKVDRARQLALTVEQINRNSSGEDPARTFEALQHLEQQLKTAATDAARHQAAEAQKAQVAKAMAEALAKGGKDMSAQAAAAAMKSLGEMVAKSAEELKMLDRELSEELKEACSKSEVQLTEEQLKELCDCIGGFSRGLSERLERLAGAGLLDPRLLVQYRGMLLEGLPLGEAELAELADAILCAYQDGQDPGLAVAGLISPGSLPGSGGISRGRGDAALALNNETSEQGAKFEKKVLKQTAVASLKETRLIGVSRGDPTTMPVEDDPTHGALSGVEAGGGSAAKTVILPQHRQAVAEYFRRANPDK